MFKVLRKCHKDKNTQKQIPKLDVYYCTQLKLNLPLLVHWFIGALRRIFTRLLVSVQEIQFVGHS